MLALANHGRLEDLWHRREKRRRQNRGAFGKRAGTAAGQGQLYCCDGDRLPLCARQLERVVKRASVGLARLGSYIGHGSGEVFLGFSTTNRVPHESARAVLPCTVLHEAG